MYETPQSIWFVLTLVVREQGVIFAVFIQEMQLQVVWFPSFHTSKEKGPPYILAHNVKN